MGPGMGKSKVKPPGNRYTQIIEKIFASHFKTGIDQFTFARDEIIQVAGKLGIRLPKNLGDVIYSFRYRTPLPESVSKKAPHGKVWIIQPAMGNTVF